MMLLTNLDVTIERTSLADSVYETLLAAIVGGGLAGGTEINEVSLAKELQVSRTPVHQAVVRLESDGLIELGERKKPRVVVFRRRQIVEIYDMRQLLESAAAARAATKISAEALADLQAGAEQLLRTRDELDWSARALTFDIHFHDVLAHACGNMRMQRDIGRYRLLVRGLCRITGSEEVLHTALEEHMRILETLQQRDAAGARRAMERHIAARLEAVLLRVES
jgi:DNA-binding GntR family transcriptional regulator